MLAAAPAANASVVNVFPSGAAGPGTCIPFSNGGAAAGSQWTPYSGFIYQNIPAFNLAVGDKIAFDGTAVNNLDAQLQIDFAKTTSNGSFVAVAPFTTVVHNTQTPSSPRGDAIAGNYDMVFTAETAFTFPGGGLQMRFSSPSIAFAADVNCVGSVSTADIADPSGYFVGRYTQDADGLPSPTYDNSVSTGNNIVPPFKLTITDPPADKVSAPDTDVPVAKVCSAGKKLKKVKGKQKCVKAKKKKKKK